MDTTQNIFSTGWDTTGDTDKITITATQMEAADTASCKATVWYGSYSATTGPDPFTVTDPTYVHKLYSNSGTLYYEDSNGEEQVMSDGIGIKQYYYSGIGGGTWDSTTGTHTVDDPAALPTRGERLGYTYMGMYPTAQTNTNLSGWNTSDRTSTWTPSGEKLEATTKVTAAKNWYAAWQANLCKVTVYDYRGVPTVFWTTYGQTLSSVPGVSDALATHPDYQRNTYNYQFSNWYITERYVYQADGTQVLDTDSVYGSLPTQVVGDLSIKPKYERKGTYNHYTVTFKDTAGATIIHDNNENYYKDYRYNEEVTANHTIPSLTMAADNTYTYTFAGWTTVDPGSAHYFTCDSAEEAASVCEAFAPVTCNITYYPVFYKTYIYYTITFRYVPDGKAASDADASTDYEDHSATYHWDQDIIIPNMRNELGNQYSYTYGGGRYSFTVWDQAPSDKCAGNATYTAVYGDYEPAKYTVSFVDTRGAYGTADEPYIFAVQENIVHGQDADQISVPTPEPKDKDGYRYTFNGWQLNGVAATPTLTEITADATYSATWRRTVLCDVEFYNGSEHIADADLHNKTEGEPISYVGAAPSKAPDKIADNYEWIGWLDADGNPVEAIPGGATLVKLYANYEIHYHNYTITFKNDVDETILERTNYHYGDTVAEPTEAQRAKAADNTYNYTFTRWDKPVVDVKDDAVYTAVYLSHYNYYEVKWLNNDGTSIYSSSSYIYNERITAPFTDENHKPIEQNPPQETPQPGYTRDFIGWKHYETGTPGADYNRSDRCGTSGATYIATFGYVADRKTITLYDRDGETRLGSITVDYNSTLNDDTVQSKLPTPKMYKDAEKHYDFDKYVNLDGSAYNYNAAITSNLSLKASYIGAAHTFKPKNVTTAPTFEAAGEAVERCDVCGYEREVTVSKLVDTIAPTATLFVRDVSWNGSEETDTLEGSVTQTANANTVVITTKDTAEIEPNYNPSGDGSMVRSIDVVIEKYTTVRETEDIDEDEWFNIYTRAEGDVGNAYHTNVMKNVVKAYNDANTDKIEHGDKFVIYVRVRDLNKVSYVRSGVLQLDTHAPDLIIGDEGEFFNADRNIFCLKATAIVDTDATSYTLTVGGNAVTPTNDKYVIDQPGYYSVTVRDVAGNSVTRNIEVKATHTDSSITVAPTCETAGSTYDKCEICGRSTDSQPIDPLGHDEATTVVAPTCEADGYTRHWCRRCNQTIGENTDVTPAYGHVYPNDSDLYGENAGQSAWTENTALHRNPTCIAEGTSCWVCSLCGKQETRTIPVDSDAHNYYRGVTTKPTCTVDGYITYTCRYDSTHTYIQPADDGDYAYLKATGHKAADEWTITTPATCAEPGSRVKKCSNDNCGVVLEETREVIPALAPHFVAHVTEPTEDHGGWTDYICDRCGGEVEGHSYRGDYVDQLTKVTIRFVDENGTTELASLEKLKGESIAESDIEAPTKASDVTYNYTFAGWVDSNNQPVSFPITVGGTGAVYKASYSSRYINYTLLLKRPDGDQFKKLGYQHNDDALIDLQVGPDKASSDTTDYTFDGWFYTTVVDGESVSSETFTSTKISTLIAAGIFNEDHEGILYPHYAETERKYTVVFGYDPSNVLATVEVGYNGTAVYPTSAPEPVKTFDELGHYTFSGWSASLTNVVQNLFVKPVFTKAAHEYTVAIVEREGAAQCTEPEQKTFTCNCGYHYTQVTSSAPGHTWGEGVGGVQTCTRCGETREDNTLYTIAFMVDGAKYKSYTIKYGETFSKPADPTKEADAQNTYAFAYWYTTDDATAVEVNTTCTGNITYYAKFTPTARLFSVAFGYDANNLLKTYTNVPYGSTVTYNGPQPVKPSDANYHYTFANWDKDYSVITSDLAVYAVFRKAGHTYDNGVEQSPATCQRAKVVKYTCTCEGCGYSYTKEVGPKLNHNWEEKDRVGGYIIYECSLCHTQKSEPMPNISLKVTVKDQNGNPVSGVTVKVYETDANGGAFVNSGVTNGNGVATISVPEAKTYRIEIEGKSANITVDANGNITSGSVPTVERNNGGGNTSHGCDCTCHKSGLWPTIFRFFHKIIKLITGEFRCCPDAHY